MSKWKFYLSGICFGRLRIEQEKVYHQPLDVFTGEYQPERELEERELFYENLGKMDVRQVLLRLPEYEVMAVSGKDMFTTSFGEKFQKREDGSYVQREKKFPRDLILSGEQVVAVITPSRDRCAILVRDGMEDRTILQQWQEQYTDRLYRVYPVQKVKMRMRDGVKLAADIYLPVGEGKFPVVLVRTPYGKSRGYEEYFRFVMRGYAVVIQDVRGREDSEGEWMPMHHEVEDGDDTLTWIAEQSWSDGGVGMTGGSYLGYVQWAAAASGNPHLKVMLSSVCAGSAFIDLPRRGGGFDSGMLPWAFSVSEQRFHPELMEREDWDQVLQIRPLRDLPQKVLGHEVPFLTEWFSHPDYDSFWKMSNWKDRTKTTKVPALIMSGWFDDNGMGTTEALDLYHDFPNKKVILGPWKHSGNADYDIHGIALGTNALRYDMDLICFEYLDHYLCGIDNGIERTSRVEYYTTGSNQWKNADNWPIPQGQELVLYLDGKKNGDAAENLGILSEIMPASTVNDTYIYDPTHPATHIIDMSENELEVPEDYTQEEKRADILCYTTPMLREDLTVTGDAVAELFLSSDCPDTDLFVRITDVDEAGRSIKLADGMMSVRYRNGFEQPEMMEPNQIYSVRIRTTKLSHTFRKGHCLRVTVTSGAENFTFPNRNTGLGYDGKELCQARNTIYHGGEYPCKIILRKEP